MEKPAMSADSCRNPGVEKGGITIAVSWALSSEQQ
jgi:hypothetical protein